jgi:molybdenum cofactor guanylyltransferase
MLCNDITAVILADGKNTRFGAEKSLLLIDNQPLLTKNIEFLSTFFKSVMLVTSKPILTKTYSNIVIVEDIYKNCGPLGGIHAALSYLKSNYAFVFACDMPYLKKDLIIEQRKMFSKGQFDVFVPRHPKGIEPLHAIYSKTCLPVISEQLENKIYPIRNFYKKVKTGYFNISNTNVSSFFNINTVHDYLLSEQFNNNQ